MAGVLGFALAQVGVARLGQQTEYQGQAQGLRHGLDTLGKNEGQGPEEGQEVFGI